MRVPWLLGLVLVGCASLPPAPARCLPAGISPAFLSWPVAEAASRPHPVDGGGFALVSRVRYAAPGGGSAMVAYWAHGALVAVDPSPDTDSPPWLDLGRIMPDERTLRATPGERCQWQRAGATRV